jgi:hypothetical protein
VPAPAPALLTLAGTGLVGLLDRGGAALVAAAGQARHHARDVGHRAVLAQLGLGLDPGDLQLQADDGAQLALDELAGRVVDRPRRGLARALPPRGFVLGRQPPDHVLDPGRVVVHDQPAVHMRGHVVPGGDDPAVLSLGRVPGRGHVRVRAADDGQRFAPGGLAPLVVVAGDVAI